VFARGTSVHQSIVPFGGRSPLQDARVASIVEEIIITHCHLAFDPGCCNNGKPLFPSSGSFYSLFFFSCQIHYKRILSILIVFVFILYQAASILFFWSLLCFIAAILSIINICTLKECMHTFSQKKGIIWSTNVYMHIEIRKYHMTSLFLKWNHFLSLTQ